MSLVTKMTILMRQFQSFFNPKCCGDAQSKVVPLRASFSTIKAGKGEEERKKERKKKKIEEKKKKKEEKKRRKCRYREMRF